MGAVGLWPFTPPIYSPRFALILASPLCTQVVSSELASVSTARAAAAEEAAGLRKRLSAAEQLLRAKEAEVQDTRHAYEGLATEHRWAWADGAGLGGISRARDERGLNRKRENAALALVRLPLFSAALLCRRTHFVPRIKR